MSNWTPSTAEGRWCGFGPYYAMFPVEFVRRTIETYCAPSGRVIDPFCGRGTTPFVAAVTGRKALGAEINPVAWVYSTVKLNPCTKPRLLVLRTRELLASITPRDRIPKNDFQSLAWHRDVLGFLNSARRHLNWKRNRTDRTLMGLVLVYLHAKLGGGLSNQLRQSRSMSPEYAARWWRKRRLKPPQIDIERFFEQRIAWRYRKGIPEKRIDAIVECGDAREVLANFDRFGADLVLTSPPYCGVTNYEYDNWIRLWMLGGPALPKHNQASRYSDRAEYESLIAGVFSETRRLSRDDATVYVRTDARQFTLETTLDTLEELWPRHRVSVRIDKAPGKTQTALFQQRWHKAGDVDVLLTPRGRAVPRQFYSS